MKSLKFIKNRISSVGSTKKITQAMKVVSAARLKQVQPFIETSNHYLSLNLDILRCIYDIDKDLFQDSRIGHAGDLYIVFGSDKGLCSSFNLKVFKKLEEELSNSGNKKRDIICVGNKIHSAVKSKGEIVLDHMQFFDKDVNMTNSDVYEKLLDNIKSKIASKKIERCFLVYTKYKSVLKQNVICKKLLPIDGEMIQDVELKSRDLFSIDDDVYLLMEKMKERFIRSLLFDAYINSATSEYSTRMLAMDNATQNSEKVISELKLLYHKARQALITKELIEIISGAEAINQ